MAKGLGIALLALVCAVALTEAFNYGEEYGDWQKKSYGERGYEPFGKYSKYYYNVVHGPKLNRGNFLYRGRTYRLKCNANSWYKNVNGCYRGLGKRRRTFGSCFSNLRKYYTSVKGGEYADTGYEYTPMESKGSINKVYEYAPKEYSGGHGYEYAPKEYNVYETKGYGKYFTYYKTHSGPRLYGNKFTYLGKNYYLNRGISASKWYWYYYRCYNYKYHSCGKCISSLRTYYNGGSKGYGDYTGEYTGEYKGYSDYSNLKGYGYYTKNLGPKFYGRRFLYKGNSYKLKCGGQKWIKSYDSCYGKYNSFGRCMYNLRGLYYGYKRGTFGDGSKGYGIYKGEYTSDYSDKGYSDYSNLKGYGYYTKNFGPKFYGSRFLYKGNSYKLKCGGQKWIKSYDSCYGKYNSFGRCMYNLRGLYYGYKRGTFGGFSGINYQTYYGKHGGWALNNKLFDYGGKHYQVRGSLSGFYGGYYKYCKGYYGQLACLNNLLKKQIISINTAKYYLGKKVVAANYIAKKHVNAVKKVANAHLNAMTNVASNHLNKMSNVAAKHVNNVKYIASKHLKHLHKLIKTHIYKLKSQTNVSLKRKEIQHRRQLAERAKQNLNNLAQRNAQMKTHKYYLAKTIKNAALYTKKALYPKEGGYAVEGYGQPEYGERGY